MGELSGASYRYDVVTNDDGKKRFVVTHKSTGDRCCRSGHEKMVFAADHAHALLETGEGMQWKSKR